MIQFKNLTFAYDSRYLFDDLNITLPANQKIGIVGKNGTGKTTLFKLLLGLLTSLQGEIAYPKKWQIAHLDQELPNSDALALEYVMDGDKEFARINQQLRQAQHDENYEEVVKLHHQLADIDGYNAEARAAKLMHGLGFCLDDQIKTVNEFSGGWRMRLKLARILQSRADLLLLDEPTNHLDLSAIVWLENWLQKQTGMMLIISHDRSFLDSVVSHIVYLQRQQAKLYGGNYSTFETQRALELDTQQNAYEKQQAQIEHLQKYINRFRAKADKAKQAQSRMRTIAKMSKVAAVQKEMDISFSLEDPVCQSGTLISLTKAQFGYPTAMFNHVNFSVYADQRIALLGANGAGKSTFIKALAGLLPLKYGTRLCAPKLSIGYFSQDSADALDLSKSALENMQELAPNQLSLDLRKYLGNFGFTQDQALLPLVQCSGGEKSRLALAMLIWQKPALLLLDEPTNHLDLAMRNALSLALQNYSGGVVMISHDRYIIDSCINELWLIEKGEVKPFAGDLADYQQWLLQNT